MSEHTTFEEWYSEGGPIPVCHPVPECTAHIKFPDPGKLVWTVTDHKLDKTYEETFVFDMDESTPEGFPFNE